MSKYKAKRTEVDGIVFDSKREAARYLELKLLQRIGEIRNLELQPSYELWTSAGRGHKNEPVGVYRADFRYETKNHIDAIDWHYVVEDVKGFKTPLYRWKKKHVEAQYGIQIRET